MDEKKTKTVVISAETHSKISAIGKADGLRVGWIVDAAITEWIRRHHDSGDDVESTLTSIVTYTKTLAERVVALRKQVRAFVEKDPDVSPPTSD